jgi:predicted ArsR family transcriptional regulator
VKSVVDTDENTGPLEVALLTVDEMSDFLGVTPESVRRTMASLKRKIILQLVNDDIPDHYRCNIKQLLREAEN